MSENRDGFYNIPEWCIPKAAKSLKSFHDTALGVVSHGTGKCPSPVFPRVHPDPHTSAGRSPGYCSGMMMRLRGSVCTRGVLQRLATANALYPAWFLRGRGWRTSSAPLPQWKRNARRRGTRREGAAVLDGQQGGMTYGAWRGTNVQSRVNWPSMPLRLVTLPFKVPAERTSSAISSTTWSPSEVALQSKAQPSSASWKTSSFVRAKRGPFCAGVRWGRD